MRQESPSEVPGSTDRRPRSRRMALLALAGAVLLGFASSGAAMAAVEPPSLLNYQGVLRDPNNVPIDGTFDMTFRFFDALSSGNEILRDLHSAPVSQVSVTGGLFNVLLGGGTIQDGGAGLPNGPYSSLGQVFRDFPAVYMEVHIGSETLSPRIQVVASAYALNADHLDGKDGTEYLDISSTTQAKAGSLSVGGNINLTGLLQIQAGGPDTGKVLTATGPEGKSLWQDPQPGPQGPPGPAGPQGPAGPSGVTGRPVHSITVVDDTGDTGLYPSIAIGTDGLPIISYYDATLGDLKVAHCLDVGCTSVEINVPAPSAYDEGQNTSITIGADGLPLISYEGDSDILIARCSDTACTSAALAAIPGSGGPYFSTSIAVGVDGFPIIGNSDPFGLYMTHCEDASCSGSMMSTNLDASGSNYASVTIGASGLPVVSYEEDLNGALRIAMCLDAACTAANIVTAGPPQLAGTRGRHSSMAIGSDGIPVFSTGVNSPYSLHCTDSQCSGFDPPVLIDVPAVEFTAITIGTDGLPVIGYSLRDSTMGGDFRMNVAHCENVACTAVHTVTVDSGGNPIPMADYIQGAMTIGTDGYPVIAYTFPGASGRVLKVAHCSNRRCLPWHRRR